MLPEVPTAEEAGLPGFLSSAWFGLVAPPGTPSAVIGRINADAVDGLKLADVRSKFLEQGAEPIANTPVEMAAFVREEMARWQKVIKSANVTLAN